LAAIATHFSSHIELGKAVESLSLHTKQLIIRQNKLWQTFQNVISPDSNRFSAVLATFLAKENARVGGMLFVLSFAATFYQA